MKRYPLRGGTVTPKEAADHFGISIKSVYARLNKNGGNMDKLYDYYEARGGKRMRETSVEIDAATEQAKAELLEILSGNRPAADVKKLGDEFKPYVPPAQPEATKREIAPMAAREPKPELLQMKKPEPEPEAPMPEIEPLDMTVAREMMDTLSALRPAPLETSMTREALRLAMAKETPEPAMALAAIEDIKPLDIAQYARPKPLPDKHAGKRAELRRVNAAIEAMGALEGEPGRGVVLPNSLERQMREAREEMRKWRMIHYADLVDWEAIAGGNGNA